MTKCSNSRKWLRAAALVSGFFLISAPLGQAIPGAGTLGGWETIKVRGCPDSKLLFGLEAELAPAGPFEATSLFSGVVYRDVSNSSIGRRVRLLPGGASLADIVADWETQATASCLESIAISNVAVQKLNLRFSKKGFNVVLKGRFVGDAAGATKSGRTSLTVKARGPWFPGADLY